MLRGFFCSSAEPHLARDGPHEGDELTGDGGDDDVGVLASGAQSSEARAESNLSLPGDVLDTLREPLEAFADGF